MKKSEFVLDCSVTMAWILPNELEFEKANEILMLFKESYAHVPTIWPLEVGNVLCQAEKLNKLTAIEVAEFKDFLSALPIHIDNSTSLRAMNSIYTLAKIEQLTIYDAAYLELAIRENISLATFDKALKKAAKNNQVNLSIA